MCYIYIYIYIYILCLSMRMPLGLRTYRPGSLVSDRLRPSPTVSDSVTLWLSDSLTPWLSHFLTPYLGASLFLSLSLSLSLCVVLVEGTSQVRAPTDGPLLRKQCDDGWMNTGREVKYRDKCEEIDRRTLRHKQPNITYWVRLRLDTKE